MDQLQFDRACEALARKRAEQTPSKGIGTLGEKTLHAILKNYCEPDTGCHEQPVDGYIADILTAGGIVEIQTRQFEKLRKKLECFLEKTDVTVVYPIARTKWLVWIDEETGETTKKRKSPKTGKYFEVLPELYKIKPLLDSRRLSFRLILLDMEEYRYLNGWSSDRKKGSSRYDRIPVALADELTVGGRAGYGALIPDALVKDFTAKDFKAASGLSLSRARTALNVLHGVGAVERTGKKGNAYVYGRRG